MLRLEPGRARHKLSRMVRDKSKIDPYPCRTARKEARRSKGIGPMAELTIVYWRDIPAQVIVGKGRRGSKIQLSERFEQAIDRAAMKCNLRGSDDYLAEWHKAEPYLIEGDPDTVARSEAERIESEYSQEKLKYLIENEGWK